MTASLFMWVGIYNLLYWFTLDDMIWDDMVMITLGLALVTMTATLPGFCFIFSSDMHAPVATHESPFRMHVVHFLRATITFVGQNMVWLGVCDMLENTAPSSIYRELFYLFLGLVLLVGTRSLIDNSWIIVDYAEAEEQKYSSLYNLRCVLSLFGQLVHNTGMWSLLDIYVWPNTQNRNLIYLFLGLACIYASGSFLMNAGVLADEDADPLTLRDFLGDIFPSWASKSRDLPGSYGDQASQHLNAEDDEDGADVDDDRRLLGSRASDTPITPNPRLPFPPLRSRITTVPS